MKKAFDNNFDVSTGGLTREHGFNSIMSSSPADTLFAAHSSTSSVSTTSAFLLGFHNFKALDGVNLPDFVKEHQTTLTFPEKLMLMLTYVENELKTEDKQVLCISWIMDGRAFIIKNKEKFVNHLLPLFFSPIEVPFLYKETLRWGFRQVGINQELSNSSRREIIFGHEFFQRDNKSLIARMRSITAAGTRRAVAAISLQKQKVIANHDHHLRIEVKTGSSTDESPKVKDTIKSSLPSLFNSCKGSDLILSGGRKKIKMANCSSPVHIEDDRKKQDLHHQSASGIESTEIKTTFDRPLPKFPDLECPLDNNSSSSASEPQGKTFHVVESGAKPSDPNTYMLKAVDLLLRYAS
eukprot:CAMPEP_0178922904 /NCGR_PEP_ID=MMETSP0786-20121207/16419_1 /TAXON_ID=186022 /ORGANISM="Thalassionema frauenfeldii, Strain CCMP 1798" /LENGTH=351 /DNA_ID=CAMNT_0020597333 /DNA_START=45 /DNA_END=1101 /DNA_ORIENTATION=+